MDPVAFQLGPLTIRWYGVCVALAFLAAYLLVQYRARKSGFSKEQAADLLLMGMVGGIAGGRILYVLRNWHDYRYNLWEIVRIDHGGLVFYGGFFGAVALILLTCYRKSLSVAIVADLLTPALPLGHAIGRIGCFLNGCCFGRPWSGWPAIRYPGVTQGPGGRMFTSACLEIQVRKGLLPSGADACLPVFPIQLLAGIANLALCAVLLILAKRLKTPGLLFPVYLMLYAVSRFILEFGRGDFLPVDYTGPFTPAQLTCLFLFPVGALWFFVVRRQATVR